MDNITTKATEHGAYQYGYDDLHRLTSVDNPVVPSLDDEAFTYDPVGNRLTSTDTTGNWSYNQNNELQSYDNVSYVYDDNGNMTQKTDNGVVTNYIYNQEDRLIRVEDGSSTIIAEYYYDPFGRRLWKDVGGTKTNFHYADEGLIGEYDTSGIENKIYGYKPSCTWTTPLFLKDNNNYYFFENDHLGTPQSMTAINGAVVWSARYSSFGKATIGVENIVNNIRYPGQYYDNETGLYYNWYRYYDIETGRYLSIDPLKQKGGINLYLYCLGDPVNLYDYDGCRSLPFWPKGPLSGKEKVGLIMDAAKLEKVQEKTGMDPYDLQETVGRQRKSDELLNAKNNLIDCYNKKRKWLNDCKKWCKKTFECLEKREECYFDYCGKTFLDMWKECMPLIDKIAKIKDTPAKEFFPISFQ